MVGARHPRRVTVELQRIADCVWEIPRQGGMRVPGRIYASEKLMAELRDDPALGQVANVAHLPGIVGHALAMPDIHWGYGFPIGGVAAVDAEEGAISPGGIGFDINCGVRLLRTALAADDLGPHLARLADALYQAIPAGVGSEGAIPKLTQAEEKQMLARGAAWAVAREFGRASDLEATEEGGCLGDADPSAVSDTALERGRSQVGTLGSGNHFLEVQRVDEVYDARAAAALGLEAGQVTVMIHSGSRGLGYQVCDDALRTMGRAMARYGIAMPDRQLACVPLGSPEGREYLAAMAAAANFAWTNRQVMSGLAERAFGAALGLGPAALRFGLVYDVCHNIAKLEEHAVGGRRRRVCVHRKGATRAFGPGHPALAAHLRPLGQPVIIPGDMGRYSFLLLGAAGAMAETFGTTCHGAGRVMSRAQAKKAGRGLDLVAELARRGVVVRAQSLGGVAEEMPWAYKDVADVVDVVDRAGLARRVARLKPLVVVKG
ncbi:MAG TPA: RtcB family protein [Verrucomicrobiae bacterium]|nr:RtcB family protein [Verrucomicrobiae bacterium]